MPSSDNAASGKAGNRCLAVGVACALWSAVAVAGEAKHTDWTFVRSGMVDDPRPTWITHQGKGEGEVIGSDFRFSGYERDLLPRRNDEPPVEILTTVFDVHLLPGGRVTAVRTKIGTDAGPLNLTGKYSKSVIHRGTNSKRLDVIQEELVFPYPENYEFFLFYRTTWIVDD